MPKYSFIIPCYGSEQTLPLVIDELRAVLSARQVEDHQLILINDGSPDQVWQKIKTMAAADRHIIGIDLARNFGQAKARMAALPYIKGDVAVFLDDDGQHPLYHVFALIEKIENGDDLVFARFSNKKHNPFHRLGSAMNGKLLELNGAKPPGIALSSFFAISHLCIEQLRDYHSPFPSFTGYIMQFTGRVANIDMPHRPRAAGKSGYTARKLFSQWLTGFTNFSIVPLRLASASGGLIAATGFIYGIYLVLRKLFGAHLLSGYTSLMAAILFIGGLMMLTMGLLGEYVGRIYMTVSDMPRYTIRETIQAEDEKTR